jgi:hypothetical protein
MISLVLSPPGVLLFIAGVVAQERANCASDMSV